MSKLIEREGKFYKECGVVTLEAKLSYLKRDWKGLTINRNHKSGAFLQLGITANDEILSTPLHIYITSDDEIKEGDWIYHNTGYVSIVLGFNLDAIKLTDAQRWTKDCKKIIATTDSDLTLKSIPSTEFKGVREVVDNLPQPSDKFIQAYIDAYNKGEKIEKVLVEYLRSSDGYYDEHDKWHWKLLAPKLKDNNIIIKKVKDSWTREEVINLLHSAGKYGRETANKSIGEMPDMMDKWIEENLS